MNFDPLIRHQLTAAGPLPGTANARAFEQSGDRGALSSRAEKQKTLRESQLILRNDVMAASLGREVLSRACDDVYVFHTGGATWMNAEHGHHTGDDKSLSDACAAACWRNPGVVNRLNGIEFGHQLI